MSQRDHRIETCPGSLSCSQPSEMELLVCGKEMTQGTVLTSQG